MSQEPFKKVSFMGREWFLYLDPALNPDQTVYHFVDPSWLGHPFPVKEDPVVTAPDSTCYPRSVSLNFFTSHLSRVMSNSKFKALTKMDLYNAVSRIKSGDDMSLFAKGYAQWFRGGGNAWPDAVEKATANLRSVIYGRDSTIGLWWRVKWLVFAGVTYRRPSRRVSYA